MIYELRTYDMVPELFDEYLQLADAALLPIIKDRIEFPVVGFWRAVSESRARIEPGDEANLPDLPAQVVWMIAWESLERRARKWSELYADAEWNRVFDPKYYAGQHVKFLSPTAASPLQ